MSDLSRAMILKPCRVRVACTCKATFTAEMDDCADFVRCPTCNDVFWIKLEATAYETDPVEYPDADMIAVGVLEIDEQGRSHSGDAFAEAIRRAT